MVHEREATYGHVNLCPVRMKKLNGLWLWDVLHCLKGLHSV